MREVIMTKLKKCQRVEMYLNRLMQQESFHLSDLETLKHKDICDVRELEGIGERTISNVLNDFKEQKGIQRPKDQVTKKQKVEIYLTDLLESGEKTLNELLQLGYNDIKDVEELEAVGKTTITCALAEFKQNNDSQTFEKGVLDFLAAEKSDTNESFQHYNGVAAMSANARKSSDHSLNLDGSNVKLIKRMISEFSHLKEADEERKRYELRELKHALHFVGIDPSKIVRLYWEDVSKDFMNRKILAGSGATPADVQINQYA